MEDRKSPSTIIGLQSVYLLRTLRPFAVKKGASCYNFYMEVGDIRAYKERWKAVEEIERQELRSMSLEEHWRKLNAIVRFAIETGMKRADDDGEIEIFLRWAKLKVGYETR